MARGLRIYAENEMKNDRASRVQSIYYVVRKLDYALNVLEKKVEQLVSEFPIGSKVTYDGPHGAIPATVQRVSGLDMVVYITFDFAQASDNSGKNSN